MSWRMRQTARVRREGRRTHRGGAMFDLVIRGADVVDGTDAPRRPADVAIQDGRIAEIGSVGPGRRTLDATGAVVTPGFIDIHTHYDAQVLWDDALASSSWHGVTTAV